MFSENESIPVNLGEAAFISKPRVVKRSEENNHVFEIPETFNKEGSQEISNINIPEVEETTFDDLSNINLKPDIKVVDNDSTSDVNLSKENIKKDISKSMEILENLNIKEFKVSKPKASSLDLNKVEIDKLKTKMELMESQMKMFDQLSGFISEFPKTITQKINEDITSNIDNLVVNSLQKNIGNIPGLGAEAYAQIDSLKKVCLGLLNYVNYFQWILKSCDVKINSLLGYEIDSATKDKINSSMVSTKVSKNSMSLKELFDLLGH